MHAGVGADSPGGAQAGAQGQPCQPAQAARRVCTCVALLCWSAQLLTSIQIAGARLTLSLFDVDRAILSVRKMEQAWYDQ